MRKLLEKTLAECLEANVGRKYTVDNGNYRFEIVSTEDSVALNIYMDYGFGDNHLYEMVEENADQGKKIKFGVRFFVRRVLDLIESYPSKHPLDMDMLFKKYEAVMEDEYRGLNNRAHDFQSIGELYDMLKDEKGDEAFIVVNPKNESASDLLSYPPALVYDLNYEHIKRIGKTPPDYSSYDYSSFEEEYGNDFIFEEAFVYHYYGFDNDVVPRLTHKNAPPIPWLINMHYRGKRVHSSYDDPVLKYTNILNYLAIVENRALFEELSKELKKNKRIKRSSVPYYLIKDSYDVYLEDEREEDYPNWHCMFPDNENHEKVLNELKQKFIAKRIF